MLRNVLKTLINQIELALGHYGATRDVGPVGNVLSLTMTSMLANVIFVNV